MGFPTKNNHFGVFWGTTIFGNTHIPIVASQNFFDHKVIEISKPFRDALFINAVNLLGPRSLRG